MENLNPAEIEELLKKLRHSTISEDELRLLQPYLNGEQTSLDAAWEAVWNGADIDVTHFEAERKAVFQRLSSVVVSKRSNRLFWGIAASIAVLVVSAVMIFPSLKTQDWIVTQNETHAISEVRLPDNSMVWLTPGSILRYTNKFGKTDRRVLLNGQARFNVSTDSMRTFLVQTEFVETKVLGTNFTVHAYDNRDKVEVALHEGGVRVQVNGNKSVTNLRPGEKFTYQKQTGDILKNSITNADRFNWQDGIIRFHKADVEEVGRRLEEWYGINISITGKISDYEKLIYRIDTRKLNLEQVISGIDLVSNYSIKKIAKNEYIIETKK